MEARANVLGDAVRALLKKREMKAFELGEAIGLSPTSVSKIMNGAARPRQSTFSRMCGVLCADKEDERRLVGAFAGAELLDEDPEEAPPANEATILRMRAEQYLERKTGSIAFKRSVARELGAAGIPYKQDFCDGPYSTDFLLEKDGERVAIECKANVLRDFERTEAIAGILKEKLRCKEVYTVVPFDAGMLDMMKEPLASEHCVVCELGGLMRELRVWWGG